MFVGTSTPSRTSSTAWKNAAHMFRVPAPRHDSPRRKMRFHCVIISLEGARRAARWSACAGNDKLNIPVRCGVRVGMDFHRGTYEEKIGRHDE